MVPSSDRLRIAVLFGGRSAEHDVSVLSATNVMRALDPAKYDAVPVFVTREGQWLLAASRTARWRRLRSARKSASCRADGTHAGDPGGGARPMNCLRSTYSSRSCTACMARTARCRGSPRWRACRSPAAASSAPPTPSTRTSPSGCWSEAGLPTARSVTIRVGAAPAFAELQATLGLPLFVKPARQGSSVGVSKVSTEKDYDGSACRGLQARQQAAGRRVHPRPRDRVQRAGGHRRAASSSPVPARSCRPRATASTPTTPNISTRTERR